MGRKILLTIIMLAIISTGISSWERYRVENNNKEVDLIMDYRSMENLLDGEGRDILSDFTKYGLSGVAIYQDDINKLQTHREIRLIKGNEIKRMEELTGWVNPLFTQFPYDDDSMFIVVNKSSMIERFMKYLSHWSKEIPLDYHNNGHKLVVFFPEWKNEYINLSMGIDSHLIKKLSDKGLKVITRINNKNDLKWDLIKESPSDYIIFQGGEVTGYPDKIEKTAEIMKDKGIMFGMIEPFIAYQRGAKELARKIDYNLIRVHSIQQGEMEKYTVKKVIDRYLRAVKERNVRILYLKPFLAKKDNRDLIELNQEFISELSSNLKKEGYSIGRVKPFYNYNNSTLELLLIGLGIIAGGIILLRYFIDFSINKIGYILLVLGIMIELVLIYSGKEVFLRELLALASSIIFPVLAIVSQVLNFDNNNLFVRFLKASLISLLGAFFLVGSLAHISFILKVDQFRGVKLAFVMPLILVSIYYFKLIGSKRINSIYIWFKELIETNIKVKHLLLSTLLLLGGIVYIGRTGNFPLIPVPAWEIYLRNWLEEILVIRPRFKEFLFGHPFFIIILSLKDSFTNLVFYPLLMLATIGQITMINTFSHVHTPLSVSLVRVFHGIWLGIVIGVILMIVFNYLLSLWEKRVDTYE